MKFFNIGYRVGREKVILIYMKLNDGCRNGYLWRYSICLKKCFWKEYKNYRFKFLYEGKG